MNGKKSRGGIRNLIIAIVVLALFELNRRWNEKFVKVVSRPAPVEDSQGRSRSGRRVVVQSILDTPPEMVWALAQRPAMLAEVTYPLLHFYTRDGRPLPSVWREGGVTNLNLYVLGLLPLGHHTIEVERIDPSSGEIQSRETGSLVEVWDHLIRIEPFGEGQTLYTDEIDIAAGLLNPLVSQVALTFYRYRQGRWQELARSL